MPSVTKSVRRKIKNILINRLFSYSGGDYQRGHEPDNKFDLIASGIDLDRVRNVLDIGCNEGKIAARFDKLGKFTVGIDVGPYFLNHVLTDLDNVYGRSSAAYGVFPINQKNVEDLPAFDLILLLSVHHQLIKHHGDEYTKDVVRKLLEKATEYLVVEFAATRMKYGFSGNEFEDNDEASVRSYAESWIHSLADNLDVTYLGKNRESGEREPFRFVYSIRTKA
jgi:SAM-dependent methyltransferase